MSFQFRSFNQFEGNVTNGRFLNNDFGCCTVLNEFQVLPNVPIRNRFFGPAGFGRFDNFSGGCCNHAGINNFGGFNNNFGGFNGFHGGGGCCGGGFR